MKKMWSIRAILFVAYCVPFAFLAVHGDAVSGTMLFYGWMIAGFALLCWRALKTNNAIIIFAGNILSFISSLITAKLSGLEPMAHYFKPLTSYSLIVLISVVAVLVHTMIVLIHSAKKKADNE